MPLAKTPSASVPAKPVTRGFYMRISPDEHEAIKARAHIAGLTVSEFVRRAALGRRIDSKADMAAWGTLRKLAGQLKDFHTTTGGVYSNETAGILYDISQAIKRLLK